MSNLRQVARNEQIQLAPMIEEIFTDLAPLAEKLGVTLDGGGRRHYDRQRCTDLPADLQPDGECCQVQPAGRLGTGLLSLRSWKSSCSASPTPAAASRRCISAVSSSPSSGWTSPAAGNTVAQDWGFLWCGRSPISTAAPFGWRKARTRARPSR